MIRTRQTFCVTPEWPKAISGMIGKAGMTVMALVLAACAPETETTEPAPASQEITHSSSVYLIRHAEKDKGDNPGLTAKGAARAETLKNMFLGKDIAFVYASEYRRTLDTVRPFARAAQINIDVYDPSDLPALAELIRSRPGGHLVVGHSNTTPELAAILCACDTEPMPETEYDRMYEIHLDTSGAAIETHVRRFGDPS